MDRSAPQHTKVRVYCYQLTDPVAIDLLIHGGATKTVQVILHDNRQTRTALKDFGWGHIKKALLECVEIRMANLTGTPCASSKVQMHDKSVIAENYTRFGSYSLSAFARAGNWESFTVVDTRQVHKDKFDELWNQIPTQQFKKFCKEHDSPHQEPKRRLGEQNQESAQSRAKKAVARQRIMSLPNCRSI